MTEGGNYIIFMGWPLWGIKWELCTRPEVALVIPWGHSVEEPQDQVVVDVVSGVPDGHIWNRRRSVPRMYSIRDLTSWP